MSGGDAGLLTDEECAEIRHTFIFGAHSGDMIALVGRVLASRAAESAS